MQRGQFFLALLTAILLGLATPALAQGRKPRRHRAAKRNPGIGGSKCPSSSNSAPRQRRRPATCPRPNRKAPPHTPHPVPATPSPNWSFRVLGHGGAVAHPRRAASRNWKTPSIATTTNSPSRSATWRSRPARADPPPPPGPDTLAPPTTGTVPSVGPSNGGMDLTTTARPPAIPAQHRAPELALKQGSAALARRDYRRRRIRGAGSAGARPHDAPAGRQFPARPAPRPASTRIRKRPRRFTSIYKASPRSPPRRRIPARRIQRADRPWRQHPPPARRWASSRPSFPTPKPRSRAGMASARKRASCQ